MAIWFHGTTPDRVESILKNGFDAWTYFGRGMEDALTFGGPCVFEVFFDKDPTEDWQWRSPEPVAASRILTVLHLRPKVLYHSEECAYRMRDHQFQEEDPSFRACVVCRGRGQLEELAPLERLKDVDKITVCRACGGHGSVEKLEVMGSRWAVEEDPE